MMFQTDSRVNGQPQQPAICHWRRLSAHFHTQSWFISS